MADYLGHDIKVHDHYYRLQSDSVSLAKISKLLYLVDNGLVERAGGLNLDTIDTVLDLVSVSFQAEF